MERLKQQLKQIDGLGYKAYKQLQDSYEFGDYKLNINHVQGDSFAEPSRLSLFLPMSVAGFPASLWQSPKSPIRKIALEDYLGRCFAQAIQANCKIHRGSGCSGLIKIATSGQQILQRNAVVISALGLDVRFVLGLPAQGRRVSSHDAEQMLFKELPAIVQQALIYQNLDEKPLREHIDSAEDQEFLRHCLGSRSLIAFIANGSLLARCSGISDKPMQGQTIPFQSPPAFSQEFTLPHAGKISGMGIPQGISLIVGGGFHGKSTLLHAFEYGVYNHIPGDGREKIVCDPSAVKIRSEDGRVINKVNISPFINHLPFAQDTQQFSTENASGSTSQAANIIEALDCGAKVLLIDEDTSATNFMIRDKRMQALVSQDKEPITPLLYRIQDLSKKHQISTIIVMGGSGDYFDIADQVLMLDCYQCMDVSAKAKALQISKDDIVIDDFFNLPTFNFKSTRKPMPGKLNPSYQNKSMKIDSKEVSKLWYGKYHIDLAQVEQLVDIDQTRTVGLMIYYYEQHYAKTSSSLVEGLRQLLIDAESKGLDIFSPYLVGNLALPRLYELAAAINRLRNIEW